MDNDIRAMDAGYVRLCERRAFTHRLISDIVGAENVDAVFENEAYLPLLRPVMRTDGADKAAVRRLKDAFLPQAEMHSFRHRPTSGVLATVVRIIIESSVDFQAKANRPRYTPQFVQSIEAKSVTSSGILAELRL